MNKLEEVLYLVVSSILLIAVFTFCIIIPLGLLGLIITIENRTVAYSTLLPILIILVVFIPGLLKGMIEEVKDDFKDFNQ